MRLLALALSLAALCFSQVNGDTAYANFLMWRHMPANSELKWETAMQNYAAKLRADGYSESEVSKIVSIINARDEATLYDPIFAGPPKFQTSPTSLLVEAVRNHAPGKALDVGMGQGRNSIYLAQQGWQVTGFDVSEVGLAEARRLATAAGVHINIVLASDEEFDFGISQWDLIAIIYPIEKRSTYRVRKALKPGGLVVVECAHKEAGNAPYAYDTNELLRIFDGFRILKYEDTVGMHEWAQKELRLVRLIAQK